MSTGLEAARARCSALNARMRVFAAIFGEHFAQVGALELLPRDVREYDTGPEGHDRPALARMILRKQQLRVALECLLDVEHVRARLFERVSLPHEAARGDELDLEFVR